MGKLIIGDNMKRKTKKNNVKSKILLLLICFLFIFSYFELTSDIRLGNVLSDIIFYKSSSIKNYDLLDSVETELKKENEELKKILEIDSSLTDYDVIYATIIGRNNLFFLDELLINKGKVNGIENDLVVVTKDGVIGKVVDSFFNTSRVRLVGNNLSISVSINNKNKILEYKDGKYIVKGINAIDNNRVGDKVLTSGLSDSFPKGLLVGVVDRLEKDILGVKLSSDIDNLRFVAVLKRKNK